MRRSNPLLITTSAFGPLANFHINDASLSFSWRHVAWPPSLLLLLFLSLCGFAEGKPTGPPPPPSVLNGTHGIDLNLVVKQRRGQVVHVFQNAVISCKGRVFRDCTAPEHKCDPATLWSTTSKAFIANCGSRRDGDGKCVDWVGCGYDGGSCDPHIAWSHVTKKAPYVCEDGDVAPGRIKTFTRPGGPVATIIALTQPQWGAYYHFLVDGLTRITWVMATHPDVIEDPNTFFHTGIIGDVAQGWFRLLGIDPGTSERNRLLEGWWRAQTVYFPPGNPCANGKRGAQPAAINAMQKALHKNNGMGQTIDAKMIKQPVALLVQRTGSSRSIKNHPQVQQHLEARLPPGWKVKIFSDNPSPSPQETCSLFNEAAMILGPHGAGFSNLLCARPGTVLVEFQQKQHSWDFQLLSVKLGMTYFGVPTDMDHYGPGIVNLGLLEQAVLLALANLKDAFTPTTSPPPTKAALPLPLPALLGQEVQATEVAHSGPASIERIGSWGAGFLVASMLLVLSQRIFLGRSLAGDPSESSRKPQNVKNRSKNPRANVVGASSNEKLGENSQLIVAD